MKLLYVITDLNYGGVTQTLINRLNFLSKKTEFELHVLSESVNDEEMVKKLDDKVNLHTIDLSELKSQKRLPFLGYFFLKREIKKKYQSFIDQLQPQIVTTFDLESHYREIIPFLKINSKKIIELRGSFLGSKKASEYRKNDNKRTRKTKFRPVSLFRIPNKKLHNLYDHVIVLTKEDLEDRSYLKVPIFQVYNSIVLNEKVSEFKDRDNIILAVGRLSVDKNFEDLILAVSQIKQYLNEWQLHIYGSGPQKILLEDLIRKLNLQDVIFLKGNSYNMPEVYNNARLLISTSLTEGHPRNLLEALSFKIPVLSYNCKCGPKEIINNGINGYLVDFNVDQLADKILKLTSDPELLQSFSDHTWDKVQKFNFENNMQEWVYIYTSIVRTPELNK